MDAIKIDELHVQLKNKYTPKMRTKVQKIIVTSTKEDVEAAYDAVNIFIEKVYKIVDGEEIEQKYDALMDTDYQEFVEKIVKPILEIIKHDKGIYKAMGVSFGLVELTPEEQEKLQKKMAEL